MIKTFGNLFRTHVGGSSDDYGSAPKQAAVVAGWTAATTGIGAAIGAARQAKDVVTIEKVPYPESYQEAVGTRTQSGCYDYHYGYNPMSGDFEFHYGYNASCVETVTDYETRYTGRTLYRDVKHHSVGFPNTIVQGALVGFGVGVVTGVAGMVLYNALQKS